MSKMTELKEQWLLSFPNGEKWLNSLPSQHTKKIFTNYFKLYCDAVQKTPTELIDLKIEGLKHTGENGEFIAEDLLENFLNKSKQKPTAKLMTKNSVFSFYKHNRRPLNSETAITIKNIPPAKSRNPTLEDIEKLERVMSTQRDKALLWFIASTSCRVGTLVLLKWQDLKPTENKDVPYSLEIDATRLKGGGVGKYAGLKQITFLHKHAFEKIRAYQKEAMLKGYTLKEDDNIFIAYYQADRAKNQGLTAKGINQLFDTASLRAFGNLEKKRFSPHDLRSFVQSALESAKVQEAIISPILAHTVKGIAKSYSQHQQTELLENYVSALSWLIPKSVSELQEEFKKSENEKEQRIKFLEAKLQDNGLSINKITANYAVLAAEVKRLSDKPEKVKIEG